MNQIPILFWVLMAMVDKIVGVQDFEPLPIYNFL